MKYVANFEVTDKISGYCGILRAIRYLDTGCNHVAILKPGLDATGNPNNIQWFDESEIEPKEKVKTYIVEQPLLKKKVIDTRTNYKGVVISVTDFFSSDSRVEIQSSELFEGRPAESHSCDMQFVELLEKSEKDQAKKSVKKTKPGCSIHALK